jgi:hypothetical protein
MGDLTRQDRDSERHSSQDEAEDEHGSGRVGRSAGGGAGSAGLAAPAAHGVVGRGEPLRWWAGPRGGAACGVPAC